MINNGSIINECRWIFQHTGSKKLGLKFDTLDFKSVFDIVAVNDGIGEFSMPLLQVTTSNRNVSQSKFKLILIIYIIIFLVKVMTVME